MAERMRIKMEAYDHKILDQSAQSIVETARRTGAKICGPIPLPTKIERYTVLRSPFVDKRSREQFEIRMHKRLIDVTDISSKTIDALGGDGHARGSRHQDKGVTVPAEGMFFST